MPEPLSRLETACEGRVSRFAAIVPPHHQADNPANPGMIPGEGKSLELGYPASLNALNTVYPSSTMDEESVQRASALSNLPRGAVSIMRRICASSGRSNAAVLRTT